VRWKFRPETNPLKGAKLVRERLGWVEVETVLEFPSDPIRRRPRVTETRRYLTTPIYYASGDPHIGHAYTTILADVLARFWRQDDADVFFLTGTDEHGQKISEEASSRGMTPRELCDQMAARFRAAWEDLDISFDRFIRTTEPEHVAVVTAFLQRLWDKGVIYEGMYRGWYCVPEERYWTEKDLGPDRTCPVCGRPTREIEEKNYFFRMSDCRDRLIGQIRDNPGWIWPDVRRNEVLGFLDQLRNRGRHDSSRQPAIQAGVRRHERILVAGRRTPHRKGHPHHPRGLLAHFADGSRTPPPACNRSTWVVADGRAQDVQVNGQRRRSARVGRTLWHRRRSLVPRA
jgi:hypothetical protein